MTSPRTRRPALVLAILVATTGSVRARPDEGSYHPRPKGSVTFAKDIAPLVFEHCAPCHRPGEVAPFPLLTYRDVRKRVRQVVAVTADRLMPPWPPSDTPGTFRDERRLTADQIGLLRQWADEGAAEGDPADLPPTPHFPTGWRLGEPDLVVTLPEPFPVPPDGPDLYRNFVLPLDVPAGKYVRAVEFRPGNRRVVHHAVLSVDPTGRLRSRCGKDGEPGFAQVAIAGSLLPGSAGFWVPGKVNRPLPDGVAVAWPKGADFVLQLHLHPSGKPEVERSAVGFYLTDKPPTRALTGLVLMDRKIDIPPGERAYRTRATKVLTADAEVYGIFPHMHLLGKEVRVTAVLPDGGRKCLLRIDRWDFNRQNYYEYAEPVRLPKGTVVVMENTHDNSADNPSNPNRPPKRIIGGDQTTEEMSVVLLHVFSKPKTPPPGRP